MAKRVFMVGAFPPPVHGTAQINTQVKSALLARGVEVTACDLSGRTLNRGVIARLMRLAPVMRTLISFANAASRAPSSVLYVAVSGGWGQIYDICFVTVARAFGFKVFLHHHSFAYLHAAKRLTRILVWMSGNETRHVVLCDRMAIALRQHYGKKISIRVVSNSALIVTPYTEKAKRRESLGSIGFLSNISMEKGIFIFIRIVEELQRRGVRLTGKIAGPFQDDKVKAEVLNLISNSECLQYAGPLYGEKKVLFLDSIDVLVFPSRYEAEPLTVHEAMARSVPVLALDCGCIPEILSSGAGAVLKNDAHIVFRAVEVLLEWWGNPEKMRIKSEGAMDSYLELRQLHVDHFNALCSEIISSL